MDKMETTEQRIQRLRHNVDRAVRRLGGFSDTVQEASAARAFAAVELALAERDAAAEKAPPPVAGRAPTSEELARRREEKRQAEARLQMLVNSALPRMLEPERRSFMQALDEHIDACCEAAVALAFAVRGATAEKAPPPVAEQIPWPRNREEAAAVLVQETVRYLLRRAGHPMDVTGNDLVRAALAEYAAGVRESCGK